jgi:serine/threonine-protein kinase HipA
MTSETYVFLRTDASYRSIGLLTGVGRDGYLFRYGNKYLADPLAFSIDPVRLPLGPDEYFSNKLFNVFLDACPDAWGRKLLALMRGSGASGEMSDFDVLTAVHSPDRVGALAFGPTSKHPESMSNWKNIFPTFRSIDDIELLAKSVKDAEAGKRVESTTFFQVFCPSFSIGGARPKAVFSHEGALWIAKFPKEGDQWNEPLIEYGTLLLAKKCGIRIPEVKRLESSIGTVLLVKRFDREGATARHMISGFTLCDLRQDGDWGSYQGMAERARRHGAVGDGEEIFRRMVFNAVCNNIDDHPRNHAFFVDAKGVRMTPAFDVVPSFTLYAEREIALTCGSMGRNVSRENLLSDVAPFGLSEAVAKAILEEVTGHASKWEEHFEKLGLGIRDMEFLAERFSRVPATEEETPGSGM